MPGDVLQKNLSGKSWQGAPVQLFSREFGELFQTDFLKSTQSQTFRVQFDFVTKNGHEKKN